MPKRTVADLAMADKRVLVRADLDFDPVTQPRQLADLAETLRAVLAGGGRPIVIGHRGGYAELAEPIPSVLSLAAPLSHALGVRVHTVATVVGPAVAAAAAALPPGEVLLLENLANHPEELAVPVSGSSFGNGSPGSSPHSSSSHRSSSHSSSSHSSSPHSTGSLAADLAELAELYVGDALSAMHRATPSVVGVPSRFAPSCRALGPTVLRELAHLDAVLRSPAPPYSAVLGGSDSASKLSLIENLSRRVDVMLLGGATGQLFLAARGDGVGSGSVTRGQIDAARRLMDLCESRQCTLVLPIDHRVGEVGSLGLADADAEPRVVRFLEPSDVALDIGPETVEMYREIILESRTVLWNGPVGLTERAHAAVGTRAIGDAMTRTVTAGGVGLVAGADTARVVRQHRLESGFTWVSAGGEAAHEYLAGARLPGLAVLEE